ncbi:MAG TPA: PKD domain-containing protein [Pyrinomonadaceae bacterium]|nr:PKD domain-containing protein [Pyrinomonadaceae bacterium]
MALWQGGGPLSVPGSGLPDLDAARQVAFAEPVAPAAIMSTQACTDCTPCPTCGPGTLNHAPAAQAGGPYYGTVGTPLVVSGLGSFDVDPGDDISTYAWTFGDGSGVFTGAMPEHSYTDPGSYQISLTVTDGHSATAITSTTASINAAPPSVPPSGTTQGNAALFIAQTVPATMTAGQSYPVSVTMRNTGTTTWSAAHLYRLGAENPLDNSLWGLSRVHLPADVAPGADVTFNFTVIAPYSGADEPPAAQFQWRMVQEFIQWFAGATPSQTVTIISNYQPGTPGLPQYGPFSNLFASRIAPEHRTGQAGEDLLSGNYNWGLGLVDLVGRAGLDLSLGLSYNSLAAWTKVVPAVPPNGRLQATSFTFDADRGFPSAGFRLGFPSIQGPFTNTQTSGNSYLVLMPAGGRVELRRVGATNVYEAADSSYLQLVDGGNGSLLLRTTDGSQLAYWSINSEYRCTEVKDRNGNYLSITYDPINGVANLGRMTSIIDTLGRTLNFNYDSNYRLQSITQLRNGQTHVWASFGYEDKTIATNFTASSGPAPVALGLPANHIVSVLSQVGLADGSKYNFDYTSWGQVYRIRHSAADGHELNYTSYDLPLNNSTPQTDCPRFTQRQDKAENWNNNNPVTTSFQSDPEGL